MKPAKAKAANIRDVARAAGVSYQTVSRVLNNHPNISISARTRVEATIKRLNYSPSRVARALATNRTGTIGIVSTDNGRYGPPKTQRAIETAARDAGYFVSTVNLGSVGSEPMQAALGHLVDQGIDGIVVIAPQEAMLDAFVEFSPDIPFVTVDSAGRGGGHTVAIDQAEGARLATRHLIGLGHREIVHISGPSDWLDSQARVRGWRTVMTQAGIDAREPLVGDWSPRFGYEAGLALARKIDFTAVFASNDQMALGLLRGFHSAGVRVPETVSIVGFDDIPESEFFWPPLTTVRPDFSELGRRCMALLLDQLTGNELPGERPIVPELTVRDSTAPPRETTALHGSN
jgi:DNA-binding LacI/PurR family transcriptional regulator